MNHPLEKGIRRDVDALFHSLRTHAWKITAITLSCVAAGAVYVLISPKMYTSEAIVQVEQGERKVTTIQDVTTDDYHAIETLKTIEARFTTDELLLRVIRANNLQSIPAYTANTAGDIEKMIKRLRSNVHVKLQRSTRLISVGVDCPTPQLAQQLTTSLVEEYIKQDFELHTGISKDANQFLVKQAEELKVKLNKAEQSLQDYREKNHAVSLEEKQNIVVDTLKDLNHQLGDATNERRKLETDYAQYQRMINAAPEQLLNIPTIAASPEVQQLGRALSDQEAQIAALKQRYRSEHPQYIQAQSQLAQIRMDLNLAVRKVGAGMQSAAEAAHETENRIRQASEEQQAEAMNLTQLSIPYNQLEREIESERALYQSVLTRLKETDVTASENHDNLRVVQPARLESDPTKPRTRFVLVLCLVTGLGMGLGVAIILEAADSSLKTLREAELTLGVNIAAAIPKSGPMWKPTDRLVAWKQPDSPVAEAFRSLRAGLSISGHDSDHPAIVFTSAIPGEGKSVCSLNYATVLGQQGLRTLLVDAELRKSTITAAMLGNQSALGLSEYLDGKCSLEQAVHATELPHLSIIPCGSTPNNPAELMASVRASDFLFTALAAGFERVVFDVGPLNSVSDALPLIKQIKQVCFIIKASGAPRLGVNRAYQQLVQIIGAENVHVVMNMLPLRSGLGCYYHYMAGKYGDRPVYGHPIAAK